MCRLLVDQILSKVNCKYNLKHRCVIVCIFHWNCLIIVISVDAEEPLTLKLCYGSLIDVFLHSYACLHSIGLIEILCDLCHTHKCVLWWSTLVIKGAMMQTHKAFKCSNMHPVLPSLQLLKFLHAHAQKIRGWILINVTHFWRKYYWILVVGSSNKISWRKWFGLLIIWLWICLSCLHSQSQQLMCTKSLMYH